MDRTLSGTDLWPAVARYPELNDLCAVVWPLLSQSIAVQRLLVWHFDCERVRVECLVNNGSGPGPAPGEMGALTRDRLSSLVAWCHEGEIARVERPQDHALLSSLCASGVPALVLPLVSRDGPWLGALVLHGGDAWPGHSLESVARQLLEPFSVALANDRRLHGLVRTGEAYHADRQALLSRLDRQDIADSIVGGETGLRDVVERVDQVAATDVPVLILGETGAGKEVVARRVHSRSRRANGPMVRVNCGAIPSELIDSELFGHEQGSFTGATSRRKGWFERADGGTLFLDEIGELPLAAQVRVLRILQDGVLERVGAQRSTTVDVRIVAATHRDLWSMVSRGTFREDLWYRISVFPIRLPPLRERREDIPALAAHFARRATKRLGGLPIQVSATDIASLVSYDWPGNVRELAAVMERAAILGNGKRLEIAAALGAGGGSAAPPLLATVADKPRPPSDAAGEQPPSLPPLARVMAEHIEEALRRSLGRIEGPFGAAFALGINPHTLRARMRKLGIDWRRFRTRDNQRSAGASPSLTAARNRP